MATDQRKAQNLFFVPHSGPASLLATAHELCSEGVHFYGALFAAQLPFGVLLDRLGQERAQAWGLAVTPCSAAIVSLDLKQSGVDVHESEHARAFMWQDTDSTVVHLLSCQPRELFDHVQARLYGFLFPDLCRVYLRTDEIRRGLNSLVQEFPEVTIRVLECVSRSLIEDPESHKKVRTDREWTDEEYSPVFNSLSEGGKWLSSIKLRIQGGSSAVGRIWRNASFSCEAGLELFLRTVIGTFRLAVSRNVRFFEKRGRVQSPTGRTRPIKIVYSQDVFADKQQSHRLVKVLEGLSASSLSVFHPNPYLHASLLDYDDGSSYDIWVTAASSVLIVPKRKASAASLGRVCNHICQEFEEGDIQKFNGS